MVFLSQCSTNVDKPQQSRLKHNYITNASCNIQVVNKLIKSPGSIADKQGCKKVIKWRRNVVLFSTVQSVISLKRVDAVEKALVPMLVSTLGNTNIGQN